MGPGAAPRQADLPLVLACGLVELTSWAALYYAVPVLHERIAAATGWSPEYLTFSYSLSLLVAALLGPAIGRAVDRGGPRRVVTTGVLLGVGGLAVVATATSAAVVAIGMGVVGVAQAATLYPPVFTALTVWVSHRRARALTIVSLFGGASSAVLAPSMAPLVGEVGWRGALVMVALGYGAVTAPLAWWGLSRPWPPRCGTGTAERAAVTAVARTWRFRAVQVCMVLSGVALYGTTLNVVALVREAGHSYAFATTVFGLVGAGQLVGRLLYLPWAERGTPRGQTTVQMVVTAVAVGGLAVAGAHPALLVAAALAVGAVRGAHTLMLASGVSGRWGVRDFGALSGTFNRPVALGVAVSPFCEAGLASATGSHTAAGLLLAAAAAVGIGLARRT